LLALGLWLLLRSLLLRGLLLLGLFLLGPLFLPVVLLLRPGSGLPGSQQPGGGIHNDVAGQGIGPVEILKRRLGRSRAGGSGGYQGLLQSGAVAHPPLGLLLF